VSGILKAVTACSVTCAARQTTLNMLKTLECRQLATLSMQLTWHQWQPSSADCANVSVSKEEKP
jgi:hypothetical protein